MQCHCYVCDLLAPCLKWNIGISSTDHCHATDKAEIWKIQRKNFKLGRIAALPASTNDSSPSMAHPRRNQVLPLGIIRLSENSEMQTQASRASARHMRSSLNSSKESQASGPAVLHACSSLLDSTIQNEVLRPNAIPVCSSTTIFTVPSGTIRGRCQESGSTLARIRYQPHLVSGQLLGVRNNTIRRDRRQGVASLRPRFNRSCMISKWVGDDGATLTVNDSAHDSSGHSDHVNPAQQYDRYATTGLSNDKNDNMWNDVWPPTNLLSYPHPSSAQPTLNCVSGNTVISETQVFSQPLTQSNDNQNIYQPSILVNEVPSYVACLNNNGDEHQNVCQNENASENTTHCGNPSPDAFQQQTHEDNQSVTTRKEDSSVFDTPSIEPLTESSHVQSSVFINQPPIMEESGVQSNVLDIENWLFDEDSVSGVAGADADADAAFPSFLDIPSPDLSPINAGMILF